ncbi:MAG: transcriptional regulator [Candidatus Sericytochromatia bacterium]|nr:MAG: transcriptional regulator [Candidatus Sericytochromatia bacterium]GIX42089.1 MAG: transcriptional regulator [Leptospiraceae bacterium]
MKLALIGDVHGYFDDFDISYFNHSDYDYIIFTGDIPDFFHISDKAYKNISQLQKNGFLIWGNHDGFNFLEVVSELFHLPLAKINSRRIEVVKKRLNRLKNLFGSNIISGGYKLNLLNENCAIFMVRPHSIGGNRIGYKSLLKELYNVDSFDDSFKKMKNLLDQFILEFPDVNTILFLGHNGPFGISNDPRDLWGCDFKPELGDFGDKDFSRIIDYTKQKNINIPLVIAGHMHHRLSKKTKKYLRKKEEHLENFKERQAITKIDNIYYVNPAKVPRIIKNKNGIYHYHISVELENNTVIKIEEKYIKKEL